MSELPLAGCRVLVTRAAGQAGKLSAGLRELGAEPVEVPLLEMQPPSSFFALDAALRAFDHYEWLIVTSANAVTALTQRAAALGIDLKKTAGMQVAAVGRATADALQATGFAVDLLPEKFVAESLVEALREKVQGKRLLLLRPEVARDVIPEAMRAAGAEIDVVEAYRNRMPEGAAEQLQQAVAAGFEAATFTSSSSVMHLLEAVRAAGLDWPLAGVKAISIGPITSNTLREAGWEPCAEADLHDIPGLLATLRTVLRAAANSTEN